MVSLPAPAPPVLTSFVAEPALADLRPGALGSEPGAHLVIDDFLEPQVAREALAEIERFQGRWRLRRHLGQRKRIFTDMSSMPGLVQQIVRTLNGHECRRAIERVGGISRLVADPGLEGGGLCEMRRGDFMRPHYDSVGHVLRPTWRRRHALFIFLNPDWREGDGGSLTLCDRETSSVTAILPVFNRCVLLGDPARVLHGVDEVRCPAGAARRSIAVYYYTEERAPLALQPTRYGAPGADPSGPRLGGGVNQWLLWCYFALRRRFGAPREP